MATRSGASVGIMASLAIFALLALVLFVLTVIFAAKSQRLTRDFETMSEDVRVAGAQGDRFEELRQAAGRGQSVIGYIDEENRELVRLIGGSRRDDVESLQERLAELNERLDDDAPSFSALVESLETDMGGLLSDLDSAERARDDARSDLLKAIDRLERTQDEHKTTVASLNGQLGELNQQVDTYRAQIEAGLDDFKTRLNDQVSSHAQELASLEERNRELSEQNLIFQQQIESLRGESASARIRPQNEASLVDARVLGINAAEGAVAIDRGRSDHVVLGMTFEVYNRDASIRPNAAGEFPPGKASVEIIRIDDGTSMARIIRSSRGNPIIEGDKLVNALYDPEKVYTFVVFGNFDTNRDGTATRQEAQEIAGFVEEWG
ncbi:MAG: hypothetical protein AAFX05_07220, partial [Planctomycetota bacterium]